jgi:2-phosphosulfolactate phosphatase
LLTKNATNGNFADQSPFQCRMDWGPKGTTEAANRNDILIIIDVIRFSSAVVTAVHHGAIVYPFPMVGDVHVFAASLGAEVILERGVGGKVSRPSLSPGSYNEAHQGEKFVLASPNGATCTKVSGKVPALFVGSFLNSSAVAKAANELQRQTGAAITVIACGERWADATGGEDQLRPSIEDYLCAGAILKSLAGTKSPESKVCIGAFEACRDQLGELIWESGSSRELRHKNIGLDEDIQYLSRLDVFQEVPVLVQDDLENSYFTEFAAT